MTRPPLSSPHAPSAAAPHADALAPESDAWRRPLVALAGSHALASGEVAELLGELTRSAPQLFVCAAVSVWQLGREGATFECIAPCAREVGHPARAASLLVADQPAFFAALERERAVVVNDALADPRTRPLEHAYLSPLGITALLAAPVRVRGRLVGAVHVEHARGPRTWERWEELVAATLADFVALSLTVREQRKTEQQLAELRARIDDLLEARTNQVVRENADLQREVDALQAAAHAIRKSEDDLRQLFAASPVPLLLVRRSDHRVLLANEASASSLRSSSAALADCALESLFAQRSDCADLLAALAGGGHEAREVQLRARDGEPFWALVSTRAIVFSMVDTIMVGFTDLTAQKAVEHQLRVLAQRDPLTQAYNRHHFWQLAHAEMARVKRYRRPLSLAMIDADRFKAINDEHGHDVGDLVLRAIVDVCQQTLRTSDLLARYGGEEFIVLLPETPIEGAYAVMERLRERVAAAALTLDDGRSIGVSVSIGLAALGDHEEGFEALLKRADEALYEAKRGGRNRVELG